MLRLIALIALTVPLRQVVAGQEALPVRTVVDSLAKQYSQDYIALDSALTVVEQARSPLSYSELDYIAYARLFALYRRGDLQDAIDYGKQSIAAFGDSIEYTRLAGFENIVGTSYYDLDVIDSATVYFISAAQHLEQGDNKRYAGYVYNNLAGIYRKYDDCERALEYYVLAIDMLAAAKDTATWSVGLANKSGCLRKLKRYESARRDATKAMALATAVGASRGRLQAMSVLAGLNDEEGETEAAISLFRKIHAASSPDHMPEEHYKACLALGRLLPDRKGLAYAEVAYEMSRDRYRATADQATVIYTQRLADVGKTVQAYDLLYEQYQDRDTSLRAEYDGVQQELMKKFEVAAKDKEIAEQDAKLQAEQVRSQRLIGGLALLVIGLIGMLLAYRQSRKVAHLEAQAADDVYQKKFAQLETMILKSQMNPHFIFNSLNSIRHLFLKDEKEQGIRYITKFAKLLRSTLSLGDQALVPLADELRLTELFVQLERLRFGDDDMQFDTSYDLDKLQAIMIPPFVVQPLVENAFWHGLQGVEDRQKSLSITVDHAEGRNWIIRVADNGVGYGSSSMASIDLEVGKDKSYGLSLIRERFRLLNNTTEWVYDLAIGPIATKGTEAVITITRR